MSITMSGVNLFSPKVCTQEQIKEMKSAEEQFNKAYPYKLEPFTHGVSDNGTIGGIAKSKRGSGFDKIAYCNKPDGTLITTYYFYPRQYYIAGDAKRKDIDKYINTPSGNVTKVGIQEEFWGSTAPKSIKKTYITNSGTRGYILKQTDIDGNRIREVKYPSGNIYKKVTGPDGEIIEYTKTKE